MTTHYYSEGNISIPYGETNVYGPEDFKTGNNINTALKRDLHNLIARLQDSSPSFHLLENERLNHHTKRYRQAQEYPSNKMVELQFPCLLKVCSQIDKENQPLVFLLKPI